MITLSFGCQGLIRDNFRGVSGKDRKYSKKLVEDQSPFSKSDPSSLSVDIQQTMNNITLLKLRGGAVCCLSETISPFKAFNSS
jgi:hypothetical protein